MFRKLMSVLAVLGLSLALASCGDGKPKDGGPVTLKWACGYIGQQDEAMVVAEVNRRLETLLPGVTLEFIQFDPQKWPQQMAAEEQIDIAWTGYTMNIESEITSGSYLALDEYISEEKTPNIYREKQEYALDYASGTVDGKLYCIPNQQPLFAESDILKIPAELIEYFDVDAFLKATHASPVTTAEVYDVLDRFFKKIYTDDLVDTEMVSKNIDVRNLFNYLAWRGYTRLSRNADIVFETFKEGPVKLMHFAETDAYKLFLPYAVKWFKAGYIPKDVLVQAGASGSRLMPLTAHTNGNWYQIDDPRGLRKVYDRRGNIEQYYLNIEPKDLSHYSLGPSVLGAEATYCTVPYTSKNPQKAVQLLDLLRSPIGTEGNDLLNLIVYGIKDTHYTLEDGDMALGKDYTLQPSAANQYGRPHWQVGNVFLTYRTPNILKGQAEYAKEFEGTRRLACYKTPLYGFRVTTTAVKTEVSNVALALDEYNERLICGVEGDGYMNVYNQYIQKLKTAGLEKLKAEMQSQADAYIAGK